MPTTINLGQVSAIKIGSAAPTNTKLLWYDTNITSGVNIKYYDLGTSSWQPLSSGPGSEIDDSIVSLNFTWSSEKISQELQDIIPDLSTYLQVGDNISDLNNDAGYITSSSLPDLSTYLQNGDNISQLNNDAGYITSSALPDLSNYLQSGDNISELANDAGYIQAIQQGANVSISGSGTLVDPYIISASGSGGLTFGNGLRDDLGVIKLGASPDLTQGLLTEDTILINGDFVSQNYSSIALTSSALNIGRVINDGSGGRAQRIEWYGTELDNLIFIADAVNEKGLEYATDYSANWTDHSLITKKWATDTFNHALTFENGLREDGGVVKLGINNTNDISELEGGGILTENTYLIRTDDFSIGNRSELVFTPSSIDLKILADAGSSGTSNINLGDATILIERFATGGSQSLSISDGGMYIFDTLNEKGLVYGSDYSANYTNRSLVDKGYVLSLPRIEAIEQGSNVTITGAGTVADPYIINASGGGGGSYTFENGIHEDAGVVRLGLDLDTVGTTNSGLLIDEHTALVYGNYTSTTNWRGLVFDTYNDVSAYVRLRSQSSNTQYSVLELTNGGAFLENVIDGVTNEFRLNPNAVIISRRIPGGNSQSINIEEDYIRIMDDAYSFGMRYNADYSAAGILSPRWIPDWGAVTALPRIEAIEEGTNITITGTGTTADPYVINSSGSGGGDLQTVSNIGAFTDRAIYLLDETNNPPRTVTGSEGLAIRGSWASGPGGLYWDDGTGKQIEEITGSKLYMSSNNATLERSGFGLDIATRVSVSSSNVMLDYSDYSGSSPFNIKQITLSSSGMLISDSVGVGLVYAANYAANFTARSLVDKEYVDGAFVNTTTSQNNIVGIKAWSDGHQWAPPQGAGNLVQLDSSIAIATNTESVSPDITGKMGSNIAFVLRTDPTSSSDSETQMELNIGHLKVNGGDVIVNGMIQSSLGYENLTNGGSIILRSPDGTRYTLTVSNAGALSITAAP